MLSKDIIVWDTGAKAAIIRKDLVIRVTQRA
jgi:hypothetical protein